MLINSYAIDCAYHFSSRFKFLQNAVQLLEPNGNITLADQCLASNPSPSFFSLLFLRLICFLSDVPFSNLISLNSYEDYLKNELGLENVESIDITYGVFEGLSKFIEMRDNDEVLMNSLNKSKWFKFSLFAKLFKWYSNGDIVRFVLIKGSRNDKP
jgi:hypothetical protein